VGGCNEWEDEEEEKKKNEQGMKGGEGRRKDTQLIIVSLLMNEVASFSLSLASRSYCVIYYSWC
jgi:hypothetical protein